MVKGEIEGPSKTTERSLDRMSGPEVSLCVPSTIISKSNAKNLDQVTNVAYQIAKAASAYNVPEIVVLNIPSVEERFKKHELESTQEVNIQGDAGNRIIKFSSAHEIAEDGHSVQKPTGSAPNSDVHENESLLFATLLQYFVTPKYLVKSVLKKYVDKFKYADKLPKLSTLPFMINNRVGGDFKEGITIAKHTPKLQKKNKKVKARMKLKVTRYVNIGEPTPLELRGPEVPVNVRVTIDLKNKKVVNPQAAYGLSGCKASYGYHVRLAQSFSAIFTELSFPEGYTESVFVNADNYFVSGSSSNLSKAVGNFSGRVLIFVGNIRDLEYSFKQDSIEGVNNATEMFDSELPVRDGLRIEDAALVALTKVLL